MLTKRSVAAVIIFSLLTCGIYAAWWTYVTCDALHRQEQRTAPIPPILTALMMFFSSGVGGALLAIDADDHINSIKVKHGMPTADNKVVWLILGIFIPIVAIALVQYEINMMIDMAGNGYYNPNSSFGQ